MDRDTAFGRLLRRLRKSRDLTQAVLAQQAFCAVDTVKKIETGVRRPSRQLVEQFADCLALADDQRAAFVAAARSAPAGTPHTVETAPPRHAQLPHQPTRLVGRASELSTLATLFADEATRLVTITGPGGVGKTRLAIALAEQLLTTDRFYGRVCFVGVAPIDTAERIVPALAEALGLPLDPGQHGARSSRQQVFDYLRARRILLVLDNLEHLLGGSEAGDAAGLIVALLGSAPGLAILATSRERLKLREEQVYPLGGLDLFGSDSSSGAGAVELFMQRARSLRPQFTPTPGDLQAAERICRLVGGMPLAIELAAGWVDTLALDDIAGAIERGLDVLSTELRDMPARHRSMRAVFDASYRRLSIAEQAVFARLAILRGGGTLEALQVATQATHPQLQLLIGASLLAYDAARGRYTLHELLRQYAIEKLAGAPEAEAWARDQHAAYYCGFAQQQGAKLSGGEQQAALASLEAEHENVRAAWAWAAARRRVDLLGRAADGLGYFYEWRAAFDDGEQAFGSAAEHIQAQLADDQTVGVLAMLRAWQANFRRLQGDMVGAERLLRGCLALQERPPAAHDPRAEQAFVLLQLGLLASEGPIEGARHFLEQSLELYQELGRRWEQSHALLWLGDLARSQAAFADARRHFQASLAIRAACGDRRGIAEVLIWDSHAAADTGQADEAEALARRGARLYQDLGGAANQAFGLGELGVILMYGGKYAEACEVVQQSLELYQELGNRAMSAYAQGWLAAGFLGIGQYRAAQALSQQALADARALPGAQIGLAFVLHYAGWVALALGAYGDAESLLQESVALHRQAGNAGQLDWPLAQLGYTHWLLGDRLRARAELLEVLQSAAAQRAFLPTLLALPALALMLAEQGHRERAAELYTLVWRYPVIANAQCFIDSFGRRLDAVVAGLPREIANASQARGAALDLWETAAALVPELEKLPGANAQG